MQAKSPRKSNNTNHLLGSFIGAKYYSGACIAEQNLILLSPGNLNSKGKKEQGELNSLLNLVQFC